MAYAERDGDDITVKTEHRDKDLIRACPGARYDTTNHVWRVPLTWAGCITLLGLFRERFEVGPALSAWWNDYRTNFVLPALDMRVAIDAEGDADLYPFQRAGVKWMDHTKRSILTDEMGTGKTVQTIRSMVAALRNSGINPFPALIVPPNSMKVTWVNEFNKWWPGVKCVYLDGGRQARLKAIESVKNGEAHVLIANWDALRHHSRLAPYGSIRLKRCVECDPSLRDLVNVAQLDMEKAQRELDDYDLGVEKNGLDTNDPGVIDGRTPLVELLAQETDRYKKEFRKHQQKSCERCARELNEIKWTTIIPDEAHRMKDPKSKQTRALWALRTPETVIRHPLTGTPIADAPQDFWSLLHFIDPDAWPNRGKYIDRWCLTTFNPFGGTTIIGLKPETRDEFFQITDPYVRRMPKAVVLSQLPPKVYSTRYVEMTPKQAKAYQTMRDEMVTQLEDAGYGDRLVAINPLTQMIRLSQFASSYAYLEEEMVHNPTTGLTEPKMVVHLSDPSNKVDALMDLAEELNGEPAGVFAQSRQLIELASKRMEKAGIPHVMIVGGQGAAERQVNIERFQRGEVPFVLATVGAGGVGITLTRGRTCVFLQRSWSMIENQQAEDRFHRIGSEIHESINIIDIVTPGTIEEYQREALEAKGDRAQELLRDEAFIRKILGR